MENKHLSAVLEAAEATSEGDWSVLEGERTITFHAASGGVGLNITQVRRVKTDDQLLFAESSRGETFVLALEDVFGAAVVDANKKHERKAGFR